MGPLRAVARTSTQRPLAGLGNLWFCLCFRKCSFERPYQTSTLCFLHILLYWSLIPSDACSLLLPIKSNVFYALLFCCLAGFCWKKKINKTCQTLLNDMVWWCGINTQILIHQKDWGRGGKSPYQHPAGCQLHSTQLPATALISSCCKSRKKEPQVKQGVWSCFSCSDTAMYDSLVEEDKKQLHWKNSRSTGPNRLFLCSSISATSHYGGFWVYSHFLLLSVISKSSLSGFRETAGIPHAQVMIRETIFTQGQLRHKNM